MWETYQTLRQRCKCTFLFKSNTFCLVASSNSNVHCWFLSMKQTWKLFWFSSFQMSVSLVGWIHLFFPEDYLANLFLLQFHIIASLNRFNGKYLQVSMSSSLYNQVSLLFVFTFVFVLVHTVCLFLKSVKQCVNLMSILLLLIQTVVVCLKSMNTLKVYWLLGLADTPTKKKKKTNKNLGNLHYHSICRDPVFPLIMNVFSDVVETKNTDG